MRREMRKEKLAGAIYHIPLLVWREKGNILLSEIEGVGTSDLKNAIRFHFFRLLLRLNLARSLQHLFL